MSLGCDCFISIYNFINLESILEALTVPKEPNFIFNNFILFKVFD